MAVEPARVGMDARSAGPTIKAAKQALARGLGMSRPNVELSSSFYANSIDDNLLPGVERRHFEADLGQGDGNELKGKFKAAHSSAALAVNCFARFKCRPSELQLAGHSGFNAMHFEAKCPTGLSHGKAPNLDVLAEGSDFVVGIESKCTEYLTTKRWSSAKRPFKPAYFEQIQDERKVGPWFRAMVEIDRAPETFMHLDVAQLIKHAFGLAYCFQERQVTLLYLYWEPADRAADTELNAVFRLHRQEIGRFTQMVSGGFPRLVTMSYPEMWSLWSAESSPAWLREHAEALMRRYGQPLARYA